MRRILFGLAALIPALVFAGGFELTWENDSSVGSDSDYTHGMDVFYIEDQDGTNVVRSTWGYRMRMYSPDHIDVKEPQPWDRQWCGVSTVVRQWWVREGSETVLYEVEAGVLGASSGCEFFQAEVHKIIGSKKPLGWDNQFKDEPVLNGYMERHHPIVHVGQRRGLRASFETVYGGAAGTTYIEGVGGVGAKAGWNIPRDHLDGIIGVKSIRKWSPFAYVFLDERGYLVAHNATLGESYFHNNRVGEQELEPVVTENRIGVCVGVNGFAFSYAEIQRSDEYVGQTDGTDYGVWRFEFMSHF